MPVKDKPHRMGYLLLVAAVAVLLVGVLLALQPGGTLLSLVIRGAALLGYLGVFLAIASAAYLTEMVRFFGRPFVKVHHSLSITGLALITVHPLGVAVQAGSPSVFVPNWSSLYRFFATGGRVAWFLLAAATAAALLRAALGRRWRLVHWLNYLAFWLATVHAILLGTDLQGGGLRVLAGLLGLAAAALFVLKRQRMGGRPRG